jgi:hypothetical protein
VLADLARGLVFQAA